MMTLPPPAESIILVPVYRDLEPETLDMILDVKQQFGIDYKLWRGCSAIDIARSHAATWALDRGYSWLYWIDADIHFQRGDFRKLMAMDGPLVCAPYAIKQGGGLIAAKGHDLGIHTRGIVEVEAAGFGFMRTHRIVFDAMSNCLPRCWQDDFGHSQIVPYFRPRWALQANGHSRYMGEDYSFCYNARELGFKLFANFDIQIGHIGRHSYRIREPL